MKKATFLLFFLLSATCGWATSFDCAKAANPTEKALCSDSALGAQDEQLVQRYRALRQSLAPDAAEKLRQDQTAWIQQRNSQCGANLACIQSAYTQRLAQLNAAPTQNTAHSFAHLSRYNDPKNHPYYKTLMQDAAIQQALKNLMGPDYPKYKENTGQIEIQDPLVGSDGVLRVYGAIPQAYTIAETALMVKPNGLVYVAVLEGGQRILYYTNDKTMAHTLPKEMIQWSARFNDRPIVYKNPSPAPQPRQ